MLCFFLPTGDFAVLLTAGMSVKMALLANFLSALSCYIGLGIGIYIGQEGEVRFWIFAIAGGIFLYVALVDMVRCLLFPMLCKCTENSTTPHCLCLLSGKPKWPEVAIINYFGHK